MKANTPSERLLNGIIKENPTFVLMLGMCPTLAVTTSAVNGIGMGLTTTAVLAASNLLISLLRKFIPDGVRMRHLSLWLHPLLPLSRCFWKAFFRLCMLLWDCISR